MANEDPKNEQPKRAAAEKEPQTGARQPQGRPGDQPARPAGQPGRPAPDQAPRPAGQSGRPPSAEQGQRTGAKPPENGQRNDANRQPKTPSFAKPSAPGAKPGTSPDGGRGPAPMRPGETRPGNRPGGQPNQGGDDEVFNQRVFDPTSEDTVVPRGRPAPSGPRPQTGGGYGGQNRGPAQGRPGGGYGGGGSGGGGYGGQNRGPAPQGRPGGGFGGGAPTTAPGGAPDRGGPQRSGPQQRSGPSQGGGRSGGGNQRRPQGGNGRQAQLPPGERLAPPPLTGAARPAAAAAAAVTELTIGDTITIRDHDGHYHRID
jgi:translation initiation factor IF-2